MPYTVDRCESMHAAEPPCTCHVSSTEHSPVCSFVKTEVRYCIELSHSQTVDTNPVQMIPNCYLSACCKTVHLGIWYPKIQWWSIFFPIKIAWNGHKLGIPVFPVLRLTQIQYSHLFIGLISSFWWSNQSFAWLNFNYEGYSCFYIREILFYMYNPYSWEDYKKVTNLWICVCVCGCVLHRHPPRL